MKKKIEKFEQLIAWQKARKLTSEIYQITNRGNFANDFGLRNQIRRAVPVCRTWQRDSKEDARLSFISSSQWQRVHALN